MCVRVRLIIANGTMERKKGLMQVSTVDEQVRRGAHCFSSKSGRWPRARRYDETVTQHYTFLYPSMEDVFSFFFLATMDEDDNLFLS